MYYSFLLPCIQMWFFSNIRKYDINLNIQNGEYKMEDEFAIYEFINFNVSR